MHRLRTELRDRVTGGIYFTTLQKFGLSNKEKEAGTQHPLLTDRRNVIIVVDEAHRSHYDDLDGYARHLRDALPNATLIAFTGTPISFAERDTRAVFGDYIDIYDLTRAVADGATVPVYFEPRLIKVGFSADATEEDIDRSADEYTVGLDETERARLEGLRGSGERRVRRTAAASRHSPKISSLIGGTPRTGAPVYRISRKSAHRRRHPRDLRSPIRRRHRAPP